MAITLDELLGRNTVKNAADNSIDRFPSFEDFQSSRRDQRTESIEPRYNFDLKPYTPPRTEDTVRSYEAAKPYEMPRRSEYQTRNYDFLDSLERRARDNEYDGYSDGARGGYAQYESYAKPQYATRREQMSLYEFTANDRDRLPNNELENKLDYTNADRRRVMDANSGAAAISKPFAAASSERRAKSKERAKLSWKGKAIVGAFIAFIVTVATLIIVNAGAINNGTATVPSSGAFAEQSVSRQL